MTATPRKTTKEAVPATKQEKLQELKSHLATLQDKVAEIEEIIKKKVEVADFCIYCGSGAVVYKGGIGALCYECKHTFTFVKWLTHDEDLKIFNYYYDKR